MISLFSKYTMVVRLNYIEREEEMKIENTITIINTYQRDYAYQTDSLNNIKEIL